jgi:predicted protein tyrosine phosphatase
MTARAENGRLGAMFIEEIGQHLQILSLAEADKLTRMDRRFWNVVSIHGPGESPAPLAQAKRVHYACFDDTEQEGPNAWCQYARAEDLAEVFQFMESVGREPLLIHCVMGISRSTAVALALICRRLTGQPDLHDKAVDCLLRVRPIASPNRLVLRLGLEQFLPDQEAATLARALCSHPRLVPNRFMEDF